MPGRGPRPCGHVPVDLGPLHGVHVEGEEVVLGAVLVATAQQEHGVALDYGVAVPALRRHLSLLPGPLPAIAGPEIYRGGPRCQKRVAKFKGCEPGFVYGGFLEVILGSGGNFDHLVWVNTTGEILV